MGGSCPWRHRRRMAQRTPDWLSAPDRRAAATSGEWAYAKALKAADASGSPRSSSVVSNVVTFNGRSTRFDAGRSTRCSAFAEHRSSACIRSTARRSAIGRGLACHEFECRNMTNRPISPTASAEHLAGPDRHEPGVGTFIASWRRTPGLPTHPAGCAASAASSTTLA